MFIFSVWVIALDTQVGVERVNASLVEMGRSFGASRRDLHLKIILFAALPEILAGVRLGLIRGAKGVVIGQLLIIVFAFMASEAVAHLERRVAFYATSR